MARVGQEGLNNFLTDHLSRFLSGSPVRPSRRALRARLLHRHRRRPPETMMVAIATLLFIEEIRQTIERDGCIDDVLWDRVVCFPRRGVQVERAGGGKCP